MGEYCALYFAEALNFEEMLRVVKSRGEAMSIVSDPEKYSMYAILKKDDLIIDENLFGDGVYIANLNSDRIVIEVKENEKKSNHPLTGLYHFSKAIDFFRTAEYHIKKNMLGF